jgi:hypothetical protein
MMSPCSGGLRDLECTMADLTKEIKIVDKPYDESHREIVIRLVIPHASPMDPERVYEGEPARLVLVAMCKATLAVQQMADAVESVKDV